MKKLLLILLCVPFMFLSSCESTSLSGDVEYVVNCSPNGFFITYQNSSGNTAQQDISSGNWTYSFNGTSGDFVYISAQANNENATVTTSIYYNGDLIETATSNGSYVIATASGSLD